MNNSVKKNYNPGPNSSVLYTPQDPQVLLTFNYHLPETTQPKANQKLELYFFLYHPLSHMW